MIARWWALCFLLCYALVVDLPGANASVALPVDSAWIVSGTYLSVAYGGAAVNWQGFSLSPFTAYRVHSRHGMSYGVTLGYRFFKQFALDGGFFKFPSVRGWGYTNADTSFPVYPIAVTSWMGYLLAQLMLPMMKRFYAYVGWGVAYRRLGPQPAQFFTNNQAYYYAPLLDLGLEWRFDQDWFVYSRYYYLPACTHQDGIVSSRSAQSFVAPAVNLLVFGLGYQFSV